MYSSASGKVRGNSNQPNETAGGCLPSFEFFQGVGVALLLQAGELRDIHRMAKCAALQHGYTERSGEQRHLT